jgi:hypothetical protein
MNMQVIYLRVLSLHRAEMVTAPKDTGFAWFCVFCNLNKAIFPWSL